MTSKVVEKYNQLLEFLNHQEKYREQFIKSIKDGLFDFSIILIWKTFILFAYEKIYQIAHQIGDNVFLQKWESKFDKKPKNYKKENIYWCNEEHDGENKIIQFLGVIYKIDSNFIKQLNILKNKRDIAAHVSELEFTEEDVDNYLFEMLRVIEKLQNCHAEEYWKNFSAEDIGKLMKLLPSSQDLETFIENLIDSLAQASTFRTAEDYEKRILQLKSYLTENQIAKILEIVFDNPYSINQVLEAGGTRSFLRQLYDLKKVDKKRWTRFAEKLIKYYSNQEKPLAFYNWLFKELGMPTYEELDVRDIPF